MCRCNASRDLQVFEVTTGERNVCNDIDLALASLTDSDCITQVSDSTFDLDLVVKEFLESRKIENLVADWLRAINGVLRMLVSSSKL